MQNSWDPEVKNFFVKIINSIAFGLIWMIACVTAGLYFELGYANGKPVIYTVIFYFAAIVSLIFLVRYLIRTWKK
jgi:hypothetical protein